MKPLFVLILLFCCMQPRAQDSAYARRIDALVRTINTAMLGHRIDTLNQDNRAAGLRSTAYYTTSTAPNHELKRYMHEVHTSKTTGRKTETSYTATKYYFDNHHLVMAEEYSKVNGKETSNRWYFRYDKLMHTNAPPDKKARGMVLLSIANVLLLQMNH